MTSLEARNLFVFEKKRLDAHLILARAQEEFQIWMSVNKPDPRGLSLILATPISSDWWRKPPRGILKCNIGTSWLNNIQNCGASWLLRDHTISTLFYSRRSYSRVSSRFESNLLGLFWAVESLQNMSFRKTLFECFSDRVKEALNKPQAFPLFRHLIGNIQSLLSSFEVWDINVSSPGSN